MKRTSVRTAALMVAVIAAAMLPDSSAPQAADVSAKLKVKSMNPNTGAQSRPSDDKAAR